MNNVSKRSFFCSHFANVLSEINKEGILTVGVHRSVYYSKPNPYKTSHVMLHPTRCMTCHASPGQVHGHVMLHPVHGHVMLWAQHRGGQRRYETHRISPNMHVKLATFSGSTLTMLLNFA